eukprot:GILJ01003722.1.p1 GENE.GILJ01003722.1~~GILJ01003722.1.p1  ORF type:complete len:364 (-),score=42.63 GILJ01003722.1:5-1096(-)
MIRRRVQLVPPRLAPENVKGFTACVRPGRDQVFHLASEVRSGKLIVHNYGHGGAGWTILFGCVFESIRMLESMLAAHPDYQGRRIRVVGAGCIGLCTAVELKRRGYDVVVSAKEFEDTTSHKAGGLLAIASMKTAPEHQSRVDKLGVESWHEWQKIVDGQHDLFESKYAQYIPMYASTSAADGDHCGMKALIDAKVVPGPDMVEIDFGNGKKYDMLEYKTILMHCAHMMTRFSDILRESHVPMERKVTHSLAAEEEAVIFNCTGLGAYQLNNDTMVMPVQGHLVALQRQPPMTDLNYILCEDMTSKDGMGKEPIYFIPKGPEGIVGGTFIPNMNSSDLSDPNFQRILERSRNFFGGSPVRAKL